MSLKDKKVEELLTHCAAEFASRESNRQSLITVTRTILDDRGHHANILITVLPEHKTDAALDFLNRNKKEFSDYVRTHAKIGRMPSLSFILDKGEKNRHAVDRALNDVLG